MSAEFIPHRTTYSVPAEYGRLPDRIILDIGPDILEFNEEVDQPHEYGYNVDEVLDEVLVYIADEWRADAGLRALGEHIVSVHPEEQGGKVLANAAMRLGKTLLERLHLYGAYTSDGLLHYRFAKEWPHYTTPVLLKHADIKK